MWRLLDRHGVTFEKTAHASEQDRPDVVAARQAWREAQPDLDARRLVFVDETGASTKMARLYGLRRGAHCIGAIRTGHWKTTPFVGGLRLSGIGAPMVLDVAPSNGSPRPIAEPTSSRPAMVPHARYLL